MIVRRLGLAPYEPTWRAMREFTAARGTQTPDELWLVEHPPVYTVGVAGREAHLPRVDNGIPIVRTDRGGQITYHGPGQIVLYTLLDLGRRRSSEGRRERQPELLGRDAIGCEHAGTLAACFSIHNGGPGATSSRLRPACFAR